MFFNKKKAALVAGVAAFMSMSFSTQAMAEWVVNNDNSYLSYVTIKKGTVGEPNFFQTLSGKVGDDGAAEITIDLASVETNVDVRNERMKEHVFKTATTPTATVKATLAMDEYAALAVGDTAISDITLTLNLMGVEKSIDASVSVVRLAENKVLVASRDQIIIDANEYGMTEGIKKLQELANLPSIEPVVPVSFQIQFTK